MDARQDAFCDTAPGAGLASAFGWAERLVRRQLDTLRRLASAAERMMDKAMRRAESDAARPIMSSVIALEKALSLHAKVSWALRLIDALQAKLANDMQRLQRGEAPEVVFATEAVNDGEAKPKRPQVEKAEKAERGDRPDREDFDRLPRGFRDDDDFSEILKRPPDEIIALIRRTLGLSPDWPRLAEEAWERETAERALPSAEPLALSQPPDG